MSVTTARNSLSRYVMVIRGSSADIRRRWMGQGGGQQMLSVFLRLLISEFRKQESRNGVSRANCSVCN